MSMEFEPELMQDFLTETAELIEQLDADLVKLEDVADAAQACDLLNGAFRALHTVKGAAGFLGLTTVTAFSHVAEDALNRLRKGEVAVTPSIMDSLLKCVDVLRSMVDGLSSRGEAGSCPDDLLSSLRDISNQAANAGKDAGKAASNKAGKGKKSNKAAKTNSAPIAAAATGAPVAPIVEAVAAPTPVAAISGDNGEDETDAEEDAASGIDSNIASRPLVLPEQKQDLVNYMIDDLREVAGQFDKCLARANDATTRRDASADLLEVADGVAKTITFFEIDDFTPLVDAFQKGCARLAEAADAELDELMVRLCAFVRLLEEQAQALSEARVLSWPTATFVAHMELLTTGQPLPAAIAGAHGGDVERLLAIDGLIESAEAPATTDGDAGADAVDDDAADSAADATVDPEAQASATGDDAAADDRRKGDRRTGDERRDAGGAGRGNAAEATIRVEVGRLETLLNLIGQMVLTKNRTLAMNRRLRDHELPQELMEDMAATAGDLDRLTSELQMAVMRTRMQPLAKVFDRYPRVIRDMARATDKQIQLDLVGKDTEVDKSVLELLADPLVHILRNSADHGIEKPAVREAAGKDPCGTIRLVAEHQGSHVRIAVTDDGKGMDRDVLGRKAVERGLITAEALVSLSDGEVFQFIFAPGFSTAEQVTDLSGRGVGMDVVRTNVSKMGGIVNITSAKGKGSTIEILIPLTVAIMPAMVVGIGEQLYCIPLQSVVEIVRLGDGKVHQVGGQSVMRLRDKVLPLIDTRRLLREPIKKAQADFAVVVGVSGQRVALMADWLFGQQEIVVKPLDDHYAKGGPFSGATIREDGNVSLIVDLPQLVREAAGAVAA